jgi:hypothetical protein
MIAGRIEGVSLKAHTSQFGSVQLRLADVRSLRSQGIQRDVSSTGVGFNSTHLHQMELERIRRQAQWEMMQRMNQMNKGWEKK